MRIPLHTHHALISMLFLMVSAGPVVAGWTLDPSRSHLTYVTIKATAWR